MTRSIDLSVPKWAQQAGALLFVAHLTWPVVDWVMDGYLLDAVGVNVESSTSIFAAYLATMGLWLVATLYLRHADRSPEEDGWPARPPERVAEGVREYDRATEGRRADDRERTRDRGASRGDEVEYTWNEEG